MILLLNIVTANLVINGTQKVSNAVTGELHRLSLVLTIFNEGTYLRRTTSSQFSFDDI